MRTQKTVTLNKDNPSFCMEVSSGNYFNITNIVNANKYLIHAVVSDGSQKAPSRFSLVDRSIYGINFTNKIAIAFEAGDIDKEGDFVCLEVFCY